jgi:hypothetical protein
MQRTGLSDRELRRHINDGILHASKRTSHGYALYTEADVERVLNAVTQRIRRDDIEASSFTAEQASAVYIRLAKGKKQWEIVTELKLHPFTVQTIAREFFREMGGVFVPREMLEKIGKQPIDGVELPIRTADQILEAIMSACREQACDVCNRRASATSCRNCIKRELEERTKETAAAAQRSTSQAAE